MRHRPTRRGFLADVGRGTLVATLGVHVASDLGLAAYLEDGKAEPRLDFGTLEPLVRLMQETESNRIVPVLVEKLRSGTSIRDLVAAGALANARTFGGEDYIGFHTLMALSPAYHMSRELPTERAALPVLKVLYRNTNRIHDFGGSAKEVLHPIEPACCLPDGKIAGEALRDAVRGKDMDLAEATFAMLAQGKADDAFNDLLYAVQDNTEVHRTVLPYRAFELVGLLGLDQAHTLLRQSVRYCVKSERDWKHNADADRPRVLLPQLMESHHLDGGTLGHREADDAWVEHLSKAFFEGTPDQAAEAAAAALAEGFSPAAIGEAISLTANQLVLRDAGRTEREVQPGKPLGSVHGDSIGVHASDSANAWRNMATASNPRNTAACLILGAYQVALDRVQRGGDFLHWAPRPQAEELEQVRSVAPGVALDELRAAVRANDQARACALVGHMEAASAEPGPVFDTLLEFAVSEDGALHAEKYYRTVRDDFTTGRAGFRWRHLAGLARVSASEYGRPAPGLDQAREMLGV